MHQVLDEWYGIQDRHQLMLEACELNLVSEENYLDLGMAGLGSCLLGGLPDWVVAYLACLLRRVMLRFVSFCMRQAVGFYNQRLQNLALRYVMRCIFLLPKGSNTPSGEALSPVAIKEEGSFVKEVLQCIAPHVEEGILNDLKSKIHAHDPSGSNDIQKSLLNIKLQLLHQLTLVHLAWVQVPRFRNPHGTVFMAQGMKFLVARMRREDHLPDGYKYKKKLSKSLTRRKYMTKSNGTSFANGGLDYGEYALDREIQRHLSN
ncbi:histone-lysine n-methyltransferase atxr3 [Quercus suber]|uniref:Histone-lysine n-methyltransferase atxr3 n=1 Tax=Quercus suber TaxID=58331 RepID=A0AAW0L9Y2_QUESU